MTKVFFPFLVLTLLAAIGADLTADWVGGHMQAVAEETARQMKIRH